MSEKCRKQVRVGSTQEDQMCALVKKAVSFWIQKAYTSKKKCAEVAFDNFKDNSGIDPSTFTTVDCVAHHIGTLEKIYETGKKPASGKTKNIQTVIIEKVYPETYGKLKAKVPVQVSVEDVCDLERNELPEDPATDPDELECCDGCDDGAHVRTSDLSAQDKKELAMYAIDQHYFFLKQLTGVI